MTPRALPMEAAPATLPPGQRIYAVGDVHGCADRLHAMHEAIRNDLARRPPQSPALLVHLGDYVDRGPDSAGVIALLRGLAIPGVRIVNLMGNHEAMLLDALAVEPGAAAQWLDNGGDQALRSWGIAPGSAPDGWKAALPGPDRDFIAGLAIRHRAGPYLFVHAGLRPGVSLARQTREDMLWIREPFLSWTGGFDEDVVVVHGHTPGRAPVLRGRRIGIDTGAVLGGPLSCAVLEADRLGFIFA